MPSPTVACTSTCRDSSACLVSHEEDFLSTVNFTRRFFLPQKCFNHRSTSCFFGKRRVCEFSGYFGFLVALAAAYFAVVGAFSYPSINTRMFVGHECSKTNENAFAF